MGVRPPDRGVRCRSGCVRARGGDAAQWRSARPKALPVGARGHSEGGKEGAAQALGRAEAAAPGDLRQGQIGLLELATRGGDAPDGRKVRGTLHWVSARHAAPAEARLYDVLFQVEDPLGEAVDGDFTASMNPDSLKVVRDCKLEPSLASTQPGDRVQFERLGYFCLDPDATRGSLVFNRTLALKDSWAKIEKKSGGESASAAPSLKAVSS